MMRCLLQGFIELYLFAKKDLKPRAAIALFGCIASTYIDQTPAHVGHSCALVRGIPPPLLGGLLPDTSSPISIRDVTGTEAVHLVKRTTAALDCSQRRAMAETE
jgi:hypothetical protein